MARHPEVSAIVEALAGVWEGAGSGGYPTIDPFEYRESLTISTRDDHPALTYDQRTFKLLPEGEEVSHWETGLLRLSSDGTAMLNNAQPGRTEAMTGSWSRSSEGFEITLTSRDFAGDPRMVASARTFRLSDNRLSYEMSMETTATNEMSLHLSADLTRRD